MDNSAASVASVGILSLATETRLDIYRYLLISDNWNGWPCLLRDVSSISEYSMKRYNTRDPAYGMAPAILQTCKAISQEALEVLYGENTFDLFRFSFDRRISSFRDDKGKFTARPLTRSNVALIRNVLTRTLRLEELSILIDQPCLPNLKYLTIMDVRELPSEHGALIDTLKKIPACGLLRLVLWVWLDNKPGEVPLRMEEFRDEVKSVVEGNRGLFVKAVTVRTELDERSELAKVMVG